MKKKKKKKKKKKRKKIYNNMCTFYKRNLTIMVSNIYHQKQTLYMAIKLFNWCIPDIHWWIKNACTEGIL